jgi:hypothetical protein
MRILLGILLGLVSAFMAAAGFIVVGGLVTGELFTAPGAFLVYAAVIGLAALGPIGLPAAVVGGVIGGAMERRASVAPAPPVEPRGHAGPESRDA